MLRNNLLFIFRNFKRNKSSLFINLVGLSTGLACTLLIFMWVNDEVHVDKFHANDSLLYQMMINSQMTEGVVTGNSTPDILAENMAVDFPEVQRAVSITPPEWFGNFTLTEGNNFQKAKGQYVGKDFFDVFTYPLIEGSTSEVLADKNSIVISESLAQKLFHTTQNLIGKTLEVQILSFKDPVTVSGVFKDVPANSTRQFDFTLSWQLWEDLSKRAGRTVNWGNTGPETVVVLKKGTNIADFNGKVAGYIKSKDKYSNLALFAVSYSDLYLHGKYENGTLTGGRIAYVRLLSVVAIFILLIACINFMNLATAMASKRVKEVGIKKAIGAGRKSLISQYLTESVLLSAASLLLALLITITVLPQFNHITNKQIALHFSPDFLLILLAIIPGTGLILGSYPALYLSRFKPALVLKGGKTTDSITALWARKGLVIFQFALSVILIVSMVVVYRQIGFIQSKNLGYNKDNLIYFDKEGNVAQNAEAFLAALRNIPGVVDATSTNTILLGRANGTSGVSWEGKQPGEMVQFEVVSVGYDFLKTLGIQMKEGRAFSRDFPTDSKALIFNEAAIEVMGLKSPVDKTVNFWGENRKILGVANDFNFESLHQKIGPLVFRFDPEQTLKIMVRIAAGREKETLMRLNDFYAQFNPGYTLDYHFMDQEYQQQYNAEIRVGALSRYFAGLGIIISCLGLFGLAAYAAEQRIKEIGIRKVNGARVSEILTMLNKEFVGWVAVSFVVATPIAWYAMNKWLENFAYKTTLSWWIFALAGLLALGIALLTVSWQSWKAATRNPVEALRYE